MDVRELRVGDTRRSTWQNGLKMGLVGCGGMSGAHMRGYEELWSKGIQDFEIVAACDIVSEHAEERANQAHAFQGGGKPAVYTELDEMLAKHPDLECVDICALHQCTSHACKCLRSMLENMLSLKNRSASQCGHAN